LRGTDTLDYVATRFAEKMGKPIRKIDRSTLEMCETYQWPGNIRELQNIVERSMVLCSGDTFRIDDGRLSIQEAPRLELSGRLAEILHHQEKEIV
jgi:DNA-binding NtrC family response regulator